MSVKGHSKGRNTIGQCRLKNFLPAQLGSSVQYFGVVESLERDEREREKNKTEKQEEREQEERHKNKGSDQTTNRKKKRTTMMNTPIVTKYTGTFASEPFPTNQRRKNTKQSRRNGNIDTTGTKGTTGRSNTTNNKNRTGNNYNNKNSTMNDEMKDMNRYCTFDRRFSRNQPIGMELEWSSKQGLVVKTVDPSGQAMQMDVIRNDIVLLIAGEDISTNANNITDAEIVQKVNTLDTSVWVRFQRDLYPGKGTKQIQPTQSVDNTVNDTNSNTNPKNNFNEKTIKKKKKQQNKNVTKSKKSQKSLQQPIRQRSAREIKQARYRSPPFELALRQAFAMFDNNNDDTIDMHELSGMLLQIQVNTVSKENGEVPKLKN